jgi:hypothetical protein
MMHELPQRHRPQRLSGRVNEQYMRDLQLDLFFDFYGHIPNATWHRVRVTISFLLRASIANDRESTESESGQLDGLPAYFIKLPEDYRCVLVKYKGFVFRISYGLNDHKPMDKTLKEIFDRMMSSLNSTSDWLPV